MCSIHHSGYQQRVWSWFDEKIDRVTILIFAHCTGAESCAAPCTNTSFSNPETETTWLEKSFNLALGVCMVNIETKKENHRLFALQFPNARFEDRIRPIWGTSKYYVHGQSPIEGKGTVNINMTIDCIVMMPLLNMCVYWIHEWRVATLEFDMPQLICCNFLTDALKDTGDHLVIEKTLL